MSKVKKKQKTTTSAWCENSLAILKKKKLETKPLEKKMRNKHRIKFEKLEWENIYVTRMNFMLDSKFSIT